MDRTAIMIGVVVALVLWAVMFSIYHLGKMFG